MTGRARARLVYSIAEAAELLGVGRSTAYDLVSRGELPIVRIGGRSIVTRPTLASLLGFDPPLPGELDDARRAAVRPSPASTGDTTTARVDSPGPPAGSNAAQPSLPFGA